PVIRRVLCSDHADAVGGARGRAQRAAHALLETRVLEAVELVAPAEARVNRRLLLRVLDRVRPLDDSRERRLQPTQRLAEHAIRAGHGSRSRVAHDFNHVSAWVIWGHVYVLTTKIAVTSRLRVASGSRIFHPNDISWS